MLEKIEQLKDLFKQREEIDNQIGELIGGGAEKTEVKEKRKVNKTKDPVKKWSRKYDSCVECGTTDRVYRSKGLCSRCYGGGKSNKEVVEPKLNKQEGKKYHCEDCDHEFHSDAHYLELRCEQCKSRKLLTLKQ